MAIALPKIPVKVQLLLAFLAGIAAISLWNNTTTYGKLNANLTEEQLDVRANGVIRTQREEIERLRTIIREENLCETEPNTATTSAPQKTVRSCTTHADCIGIDVVCSNSFCTELPDPVCACQGNGSGAYILCVAEQGQGTQARITNCEGKACTDTPEPTCI